MFFSRLSPVVSVASFAFGALWPLSGAESTGPLPPQPRPPILSPAETLKTFEVPPGYRLELVLSEPQIRTPAVTVFDGNGRMFVAEMRTYMRDIDATDEKAPTSRVSMHWSSKNDGVFDRHSVFIDGLLLPRMLLPLRDSLLVQETDSGDIFEYRDSDGDGVADTKRLFYHREPQRANLEHQSSGLIWSADNWIYTTATSSRIRWTPRGIIQEPTAADGGQWGLTQDNLGKPWFVNAGGETGPTNFQYPIVYGAFNIRQQISPDYKEVWPLVAIPDVEGGARRFRPVEKTLNHITAACGAEIYRGDHLPADLLGDLLYCEPVGRLIRRTKIETRAGLTYLRNAYEKSEFIRSSDPYFRPINLVTAPDGALYITDMSRGIVQEGSWTKQGSYLRTVIEQYGLDQNINNGRIWRLVREGQPLGPRPQMLNETPAQLVSHLSHPNGWWRTTAQKLLILAEDQSVVPALQTMARTHPDTLARFHALWTLEGLGALDAALIHETLRSASPELRVAALRLGETLIKAGESTLGTTTLALLQDPDPAVANQAMLSAQLLKLPEAKTLIQKTAVTHASPSVKEIAAQLLNPLSGQIAPGFDPAARGRLQHGKQIYQELCFTCHGIDGRGTPIEGSAFTLAPPLAGSTTVLGHRDLALNAVIFGLAGPIAGHAYDATMAPMGANDDAWLADIVSYIRTSFGNTAGLVSAADVARLRAASPGRTETWTLVALHPLVAQPIPNRAAWRLTSNRVRLAGATALTTSPITLPFTVESSQTSGAWLQIELPAPATLCEIRLGSTQYPRNAARAITVELSANGTDWSAPIATVKGNAPVLEFSFAATEAKFLRLTQTDPATNAPWSLDDLILFTPPAPRSTSGTL